jgi:hypothetical protein
MNRFAPQIAKYLEMFRCGDAENAFHGLLEMGPDILPGLMEVSRAEKDPGVREFLVGVIWKYREQSAIAFLGEALFDPEPRVWREALDGLVTLASPQVLRIMRAARKRASHSQIDDFLCWIDEAIGQAEIVLRKK